MIRSIAGSIARPLAVAITGASGGAAPAPDAYAANGFSPDYVADFSAASADYFRVAGSDSDFATAFTSDSEGGGLATQVDSSGNLVWRPHNELAGSTAPGGAGWGVTNVSVTANQSDFAGGTDAALVTVTDASSDARISRSIASQAVGTRLTAVVVAKLGSQGDVVSVDLFSNASPFNRAWYEFDLNTQSTTPLYTSLTNSSASLTSLGGGWFLCSVSGTITHAGTVFGFLNIGGDGSVGSGRSLGDNAYFFAPTIYRSDLGGMADNPDPVATGLEKYVPTTTAARFLARRRHHRWNGTAWVPTCLHEPVGPVTNVMQYSNDFSQWTIGTTDSLTVTPNSGTGPDGNASLDLLEITDTTNEAKSLFRSESVSAATTYVISAYIRDDDQRYVALRWYRSSGNRAVAVFDLQTSTVTQESSGGSTSVNDSGVIDENGLKRIWMAATDTTATTMFAALDFASTGTPTLGSTGAETYVGTAGVGLFAGFVDVTAGSLPSSHIPTNGSTVTRAADTLKGRAASLPYSSTAISMAIAGRTSISPIVNRRLLSWYQDGSNYVDIYTDGGGNVSGIVITGGVVEIANAGGLTPGPSESFAAALRLVASGDLQVAEGGVAGTAQSATTPAMPPLSDNNFRVFEAGSGGNDINGTVDTIRLWDEDVGTTGITEATA